MVHQDISGKRFTIPCNPLRRFGVLYSLFFEQKIEKKLVNQNMSRSLKMKKINSYHLLLVCILGFIVASCSAPSPQIVKREGNKETVIFQEDGETSHQLVYTYQDGKKIMGEYWQAIDPESGPDKYKPNKLAKTKFAKIAEQALADSGVEIPDDIELMQVKDGLQLKFVKLVEYDANGRPVTVKNRGITTYPVVGSFRLKNNLSYHYNTKGLLDKVIETNLNVDSLLLNMAVINVTSFERDQRGRPLKATKIIGSVPPGLEETEYQYYANSAEMNSTKYTKSAIDLSKLEIIPSEIIFFEFKSGVLWNGKKKYDLSLDTLESLSITDAQTNKSKLSAGSSLVDRVMFMKALYDFKENEVKGPKWRLGELPDVPEPFLLYGDAVWW